MDGVAEHTTIGWNFNGRLDRSSVNVIFSHLYLNCKQHHLRPGRVRGLVFDGTPENFSILYCNNLNKTPRRHHHHHHPRHRICPPDDTKTTQQYHRHPIHTSQPPKVALLSPTQPAFTHAPCSLSSTSRPPTYSFHSHRLKNIETAETLHIILNILCAGHIRSTVVLVSSSIRRWRRSTPWLAAVRVMTGCVAASYLNWLSDINDMQIEGL